jgi:ABC-type molybdate transport system substrate-binding protein
MKACRFLFALLLVSIHGFGDEPALRLHAAGSLREPMTEMTQAFTASGGPRFESTFGAQLDAIRCQVIFSSPLL